ncbi:hypothetical protein [Lacrimispora amygdalina]|uniref:hypothetical protein n=1 Tax=Lacrimispora amygdalina TaxID=253257 RepID=UPI000BE36E19|nr:hypothetical protein [Lacrimispora amygdalina]
MTEFDPPYRSLSLWYIKLEPAAGAEILLNKQLVLSLTMETKTVQVWWPAAGDPARLYRVQNNKE